MTLKELLAEKKQALIDLTPALQAEDVSEETVSQGEALVKEIEELTLKAAKAEKASEILNSIGKPEDTKTDNMGDTKMDDMKTFTQNAANMTDKKAGVTMHLKAATDVVTSAQIADVDRSIAPQPRRNAVADYFSQANVSGNAITYFLQGAYEGVPAVTAESAKKPQNSTSFTGTTLALSKIAAYIKETDEIRTFPCFRSTEFFGLPGWRY